MRPSAYHALALPAELRHRKALAAEFGFEPKSLISKTSVLPVGRLRKSSIGAAGLEPASRANPALAAYKTAALPLSYAPKNGCGGRTRTFNLSVQSRAPCQFGHSAKSLVAGEGVAPSAFEAYETFEPLLLHARRMFWWLVVDSHHSLRLFRPTLAAISATQP